MSKYDTETERLRKIFPLPKVNISAFDVQEGGSHYKDMKIQPMEYALANNLNYGQANAIKYISRYKNKNGMEDLNKAIHCIQLLIEFEEKNAK